MNERTHIDLFSGIGGFALACRIAAERTGATIRTIGFCERDTYCQRVLAKHWPGVPCHDDIRTYRPTERPWLLTGGFPCQPFSVAGKREGASDDRFLWPEMLRVIVESRPAWVLGENVAGFVSMELDRCLFDMEAIGYTARPFVIPACAVDAPHRRDRVWIVAKSGGGGRWKGSAVGGQKDRACAEAARPSDNAENVADADGSRFARFGGSWEKGTTERCWWLDEGDWFAQSGMGRVASRIPRRMDRLKALGNSIVPQVAAEIIVAMIASE